MGLLDAYARGVNPKYAEKKRAEEYSDVWKGVEEQLAEAGNKAEHHPMRVAEMLLRSGNPTAVKTGTSMMESYHTGKTQDIKHHEYGMTIEDQDVYDQWKKRNPSLIDQTVGSPIRIKRGNGSPGWGVAIRSPDGSIRFQDLQQDAWVDPKVVNLGGGIQGLTQFPQGGGQPAPAPGATPAGASAPQATPAPAGTPPPTGAPGAGGQPAAGIQPVTGVNSFADNEQQVAEAKATGKATGEREVKAKYDRQESMQADRNNVFLTARNRDKLGDKVRNAIDIITEYQPGSMPWDENYWEIPPTGDTKWVQLANMYNTSVASAGYGKMLNIKDWDPGPYQRLAKELGTIKANLGFDKLQEMREASPTGGALGQVSDFENELLIQSMENLDQSNRPEDLVRNLFNVMKHYENIASLQKIEFIVKHKIRPDKDNYQEVDDAYLRAIKDVVGLESEFGRFLVDEMVLMIEP